jgi:toxin ParE1/3/4
MKLEIHPEAADETAEAALFYNRRDVEVSRRFRTEVYAAIERARSQPLVYRVFEDDLRKVRVERFPYSVIFRLTADTMQVLAVAHGSREPGYWRQRV